MILEIRKSYIFLFFLLLHVVFWRYSNNELSTLIIGDWIDLWRTIIDSKGSNEYYQYHRAQPYGKFFHIVQEATGHALYIAMILFSLLNTFLFLLFIKIFDIFDKRYSAVAALIIIFFSPSLIYLIVMYKDVLAYYSFVLILFIIVRVLSNQALGISKTLFLYGCSVFFIMISRGTAIIDYLTLIIYLSLLFSFVLLFRKPFFIKSITPLVIISIIHMVYFYGNVDLDTFKKNGFFLNQEEIVVSNEEVPNRLATLKERRELVVRQLDLVLDERKSLSTKVDKQNAYMNSIELKRAITAFDNKIINLDNMNNIDFLTYRIQSKFRNFLIKLRSRKYNNFISVPNASLNYDNLDSIAAPDIIFLTSHIPKTIFAPFIHQIFKINANVMIKTIYILDTLVSYILTLAIFYYIIVSKLDKMLIIIVILSCMYITCLADSNFGTYLRHAYLFDRILLGIGLLGLLKYFKPNISVYINKSFF